MYYNDNLTEKTPNTNLRLERAQLTTSDTNSNIKRFDAFLSYAPKQSDFIEHLRNILENEPHCLALFDPSRDSLMNDSEYEATCELIKNRTKTVIIVLSKDYLESEHCNFSMNFAHSLSPAGWKRKILPIIYEKCQVPDLLRTKTYIDYTRNDLKVFNLQ